MYKVVVVPISSFLALTNKIPQWLATIPFAAELPAQSMYTQARLIKVISDDDVLEPEDVELMNRTSFS